MWRSASTRGECAVLMTPWGLHMVPLAGGSGMTSCAARVLLRRRWDMTPPERTVQQAVGHCNPKGELFVALLREAGEHKRSEGTTTRCHGANNAHRRTPVEFPSAHPQASRRTCTRSPSPRASCTACCPTCRPSSRTRSPRWSWTGGPSAWTRTSWTRVCSRRRSASSGRPAGSADGASTST